MTSLSLSPAAWCISVVVNEDVKVSSLTTSQLRRIYTMRQIVWPNGEAITVYVLPSSHDLHKRFSKQVLKIFPYQLDRIWNKSIFSGVGNKPIVVKSPEELFEAVSITPGAIGYMDGLNDQGIVNVIKIEE